MDSDERFKHLVSDPRFKNLRKKKTKVEVDERFQSMFTDERFGLRENLKEYYKVEDEPLSDKEENGSSDEDDVDEAGGQQEELSSSSDEAETDDDDGESGDIDDWQALDHDAERAEIRTKRLAIMNLDWKNLNIEDIYVLLGSIRPPIDVKIYVSEYGKERLAKEEVDGPDLPEVEEEEDELEELEDHIQALKKKANQYEDADELPKTNNEAVRRYQLSQLKYYYAIAEFDSAESAQAVYSELDGVEYEGSSLELDLRFVPDDVEFDSADIRAECDKAPDLATYKAPQFIASALQQTTVKCTWDETDVKRQQKLRKAYTKEELEKDDLEAYLASDTESDEERADKYKELLMELKDDDDKKKKKLDVDVEWDGSDDDVEDQEDDDDDDDDGNDDDDDDDDDDDQDDDQEEEEEEESEMNDEEEVERGKTKRKRKGEGAGKGARDVGRDRAEKRRVDAVGGGDDDDEHDEGLDLLVMESDKQEDFKFDPDDDRFKAVYESGLYNIDPSHPNFKRTEAFNRIAEKKREKRRKVK